MKYLVIKKEKKSQSDIIINIVAEKLFHFIKIENGSWTIFVCLINDDTWKKIDIYVINWWEWKQVPSSEIKVKGSHTNIEHESVLRVGNVRFLDENISHVSDHLFPCEIL